MKLTNNSELLIHFFLKKKCIEHKEHSKKTNKIIKKLYNDIYTGYKFVNDIKIKNEKNNYNVQIKKINNLNDIPKPKNMSLNGIPDNIKKIINDNSKTEISYTFSLFDRKIKIHFIDENPITIKEIQVYNSYIEYILIWLYIVNKYSSHKCSKQLNIYLYLTSLRKELPTQKDIILNENNVNTAFTTTCPIDSEIIVYRKEEWFKVMIHETIHNFSLDFSGLDVNECHEKILSIFPVKSEVNLYEAYTEVWAEIMNALFCSFNKLDDKKDIEQFIINSEFFLYFERSYSFFQLVKTLNFMGLTYKDLYSSSFESKMKREKYYKEDSNILSYYIITTILLNNYEGFLSWCEENNGENSLLQFKPTNKNMIEFCNLIENNYKTKSMLEGVECGEKFLNIYNNKNLDKELNYLLKNMRMTICELG
jgi:hypothetical protein